MPEPLPQRTEILLPDLMPLVTKRVKIPINILLMPEYPNARLPEYAHDGDDIGADLFCGEAEEVSILPHHTVGIHTGVRMQFPKGYGGLLKEKSGLALKSGIAILGGVIDSGYTGEIIVIVNNTSHHKRSFKPGEKVAQIQIIPILQGAFTEVKEFIDTGSRGDKGFGSTGTK